MGLLTIERVVVEPEHALSRRTFIGGLAGAAAAIAVGHNAFAAQDATPAPGRTIETIHGPVVIPANPTRIIAINFPSAVALLELGVIPVGIPNYLPAFPAGHPTAEGAEVIQNSAGEIDFEVIVRLKPDLILGSDWTDPTKQLAPYEQLSAIAPTALFEWTQAAGNWEAEAAGCAEAIGKTAELIAMKEAFETKAATIKSTYSKALSEITWDLISASNTNWYLYGPTSSHGKVVVLAGVTLGAAKGQTDGYLELSLEQLNLLENTDVLLTRSFGDETYAELTKLDTFNNLKAVTGQHLLQTEFFFPSSYGLSSALLDDVEVGLKSL
ncbi:N/A [soil metagenome]